MSGHATKQRLRTRNVVCRDTSLLQADSIPENNVNRVDFNIVRVGTSDTPAIPTDGLSTYKWYVSDELRTVDLGSEQQFTTGRERCRQFHAQRGFTTKRTIRRGGSIDDGSLRASKRGQNAELI